MDHSNFTIIPGTKPESINIEEWQKNHPNFCAIVERDPERPGYGWIVYRGSRPYTYPIEFMLNMFDDPTAEFGVDLHNCYEIFPEHINLDGYSLSKEHVKAIIEAKREGR